MTGPEPPRFVSRYDRDAVAEETDGRLNSPSFERNYVPIRDAVAACLAGASGAVLEIGSGTGQHVAHLARDLPGLRWVPSDREPGHLASIRAWSAHVGAPQARPPLAIDATEDWAARADVRAEGPFAGVLACNVIHIAPWSVAEGVVAGAAGLLAPGAFLMLYGPFREGGRHTSESNARFDASLRARNPDWGVRDLDEVAALAAASGFGPPEVTRMPANNLFVAFRRN